jgi:hypothetical protein
MGREESECVYLENKTLVFLTLSDISSVHNKGQVGNQKIWG